MAYKFVYLLCLETVLIIQKLMSLRWTLFMLKPASYLWTRPQWSVKVKANSSLMFANALRPIISYSRHFCDRLQITRRTNVHWLRFPVHIPNLAVGKGWDEYLCCRQFVTTKKFLILWETPPSQWWYFNKERMKSLINNQLKRNTFLIDYFFK